MNLAEHLNHQAAKASKSPSEAQKEAGNYQKNHVKAHGFDVAIENARGSYRRGVGKDGKPWAVRMPHHYGYIKRSEGADGDNVDVYIGPHLKSPRVFVVDQIDEKTKKFDEHKAFFGFASKRQVENAYKCAFSDGKGKDRLGAIHEMTVDEFKHWMKHGDQTKPIARASGGRAMQAGGTPTLLSDSDLGLGAPSSNVMSDAEMGISSAPASTTTGGMFSDIWPEIKSAATSGLSSIERNLNPFSTEREAAYMREANAPTFMEGMKEAVSQLPMIPAGVAGVGETAAAPITGATRSLIGHPMAAAEHAVGTVIAPEIAAKDNPQQMYEQAKSDVDLAMMGLSPRRPVALPSTPTPPFGVPLGVTLSQGQATGELPLIQREQAALRGTAGTPAEKVAQEFAEQQASQVAQARENVAKSFDPFAQTIAQSPQEAGALVSQGVQTAAKTAKGVASGLYKTAQQMPGEIHAGAFEGLPQQIKGDLTLRPEPVIIDQNTPGASKMIDYLDQKIGNLNIPNKADPFGPPNPENIVGVSLKGIEQWRKALSVLRRDAFGGQNAGDQRAAQAVLDAFDNHIDQAVNGGMFTGDVNAVKAWNAARAAYSDYRKTYTAQPNDPVGRVIQKITGKGPQEPITPNDTVDYMLGASGTNPNSLNLAVTNRIKDILGPQSPEWSAVKQGLFWRLVTPGEGMAEWGPGRVAQRLNDFMNVNGKEMANAIYSPQERQLIQQYADVMRKLQVPQSGANWSNTATFMQRAMHRMSGWLGTIIGASLIRSAFPAIPWGLSDLLGFAGTQGARTLSDIAEARKISKQMPLISRATAQYQKELASAVKNNRPPSDTVLRLAGTNLSRALRPLGTSFENFWTGVGTVPTPAETQQQQSPGIGNNQPNQGMPSSPQGFAKGGAVKKLSHNAVHYTPRSKYIKERCSVCRHFVSIGSLCKIVQSPIRPNGWCNRFEAKEKIGKKK